VLLVAAALLTGAIGVTLLAVVAPIGRRRGWRPGRREAESPIPEDGPTYAQLLANATYDAYDRRNPGARAP
jgi:hypothetical protein